MRYEVVVTREGGNWLADVPSVLGAHTFARSLEGLDRSVREVIVLMGDLPDEVAAEVVTDFRFDVEDEVVRSAAALGRDRAELAAREEELRESTAGLVRSLVDAGYSVRDAGRLLGMTPGRISQLSNA